MNKQPVIDATILDEAKNQQMNQMFLDMMRLPTKCAKI